MNTQEKNHFNKVNPLTVPAYGMVFFVAFFTGVLRAQTYAPPVGQAGTTAMHKDSSAFVNWAVNGTVTRGYQDISNTGLGFATAGDNYMLTGKAESNGVVSLGDGGVAVCTFEKPIRNGAGFDFAVFENGFDDVFLELAFVEVSSDGINFFRFPAHSLTDTLVQTNGFGSTDAVRINNLAGKYRGGYGTPFDLQELAGTAGLNINAITHVKMIDVVGSISSTYASRDFYNNKINDPWPTPFPSSGFDLDAVGVVYENTVAGLKENRHSKAITVYPNPCRIGEKIHFSSDTDVFTLEVIDSRGVTVFSGRNEFPETHVWKPGVYFLRINSNHTMWYEKLIVL